MTLGTNGTAGFRGTVDDLWAKSADPASDYVPLRAHLLDVAAVVSVMLDRMTDAARRRYAADLGLPWEQARPWLLALAALHDLGKASPVFQAKWEPGAERLRALGLSVPRNQKDPGHGLVSQHHLATFLATHGWPRRSAELVADAVGCHHGLRATATDLARVRNNQVRGGDTWTALRDGIAADMLTFFGCTTPPTVAWLSAGAFVRLAGLVSVADWFGSGLARRPFDGDLAAWYAVRTTMATEALDEAGWSAAQHVESDPDYGSLFAYAMPAGVAFVPRPLQAIVKDVVDKATEPVVILVEAPMGEGKTEASLYAHAALRQRLGHDGFYIALPTQATSNQMFTRTRDFLQASGGINDLQLSHGGTALNADYQRLIGMPNTVADRTDAVVALQWFTNRKRNLLSNHGVGTVDQILLSVLPVRHFFVRLWGLENKTIIIDEAHAYDAYTSGLLVRLVEWLRAVGSSVVIMSATLPPDSRKDLFGVNDNDRESLPNQPYPRVTVREGTRVEAYHAPTARTSTVTVRHHSADPDDIAAMLIEATEHGGCVAAIVNTVGRAQEIYTRIRDRVGSDVVQLFHARYAGVHRIEREQRVLRTFGKGVPRPERAILIATQVVEQSLDVDFDLLYSDLAPVDLILQRLGRLHRHNRPERTIAPQLLLGGAQDALEKDPLRSVGGGSVYARYVMLRTAHALRDRRHITLPTDIDALVDLVYDDRGAQDITDDWAATIADAWEEFKDVRTTMRTKARNAAAATPLSRQWEDAPPEPERFEEDDPDVAPKMIARTRLGEPSVTVIPVIERNGVSETIAGEPLGRTPTPAVARTLSTHGIRVSLPQIVHAAKELRNRTFPSWNDDPILRGAVPIVFRDGMADVGSVTLSLDPDLGLMYSYA